MLDIEVLTADTWTRYGAHHATRGTDVPEVDRLAWSYWPAGPDEELLGDNLPTTRVTPLRNRVHGGLQSGEHHDERDSPAGMRGTAFKTLARSRGSARLTAITATAAKPITPTKAAYERTRKGSRSPTRGSCLEHSSSPSGCSSSTEVAATAAR